MVGDCNVRWDEFGRQSEVSRLLLLDRLYNSSVSSYVLANVYILAQAF